GYNAIRVEGGTGGNNAVIDGNISPLQVQPGPYPGAPTDHVYLGNGTLQGIQAPVTVTGPYNTVSVDVNDQNDTANRLVGLDSYNGYGSVTWLAPAVINYATSHITDLTLHLGTGQDY